MEKKKDKEKVRKKVEMQIMQFKKGGSELRF